MTVAAVKLWGREIAAVSWDTARNYAFFEYDREFAESGIQIAPLTMPLSSTEIYSFPGLPKESFRGLPGLLADSLPDRFGNALIDAWLSAQGRTPESFNPVERLCYTGARGMGALEFEPAIGPAREGNDPLDIDALVRLAGEVLTRRTDLAASFDRSNRAAAMRDILRVGTSAGGARAKAVIAWNPATNEVRSGQVEAGEGFEYWLLKFDGVSGNRDKELDDPQGYGLIEYAYAGMAAAAGIEMSECRILEESGRHHFMTRRFDRGKGGRKRHLQTLGGLAHYDYNQAGAYSYEQALAVIRRLGLPMHDIEQQYRRMVFNILARNQDDHVKNISFLMDQSGRWSLSPAYDMTYSFNPQGAWSATHQMSLGGKRDHFETAEFERFAELASMKRGRWREIFAEVDDAVGRWHSFADEAGVPGEAARRIAATHRRIL